MKKLTLHEAIAEDRLEDFAKQAETDGVGPASEAQFDALVKGATERAQARRTSGSRTGDDSPGT
jgi:hypothetical protein